MTIALRKEYYIRLCLEVSWQCLTVDEAITSDDSSGCALREDIQQSRLQTISIEAAGAQI